MALRSQPGTYTSESFSLRKDQSCLPELFLVEALVQQIIWNSLGRCDCPYSSLPGVDLLCYCALTLQQSFCFLSSLLFDAPADRLIPVSADAATPSFLVSAGMAVTPNVDLGPWGPEESMLFTFSLGLSISAYQVLKKA